MLISETSLRSRNKRKDDALRRKVTTDLKKKPSTLDSLKNNKKKVASVATVASLNPNAAITVSETVSITQAAALMSSKRADAVLVIGSNGLLSGILTDKDIAYRVVAAGLDVKTTLVQSVMTPNPLYVYDNSPRQDALTLMTSKGFRHLPVLSELIDTDGSLF